jgi:hypothetical protein
MWIKKIIVKKSQSLEVDNYLTFHSYANQVSTLVLEEFIVVV